MITVFLVAKLNYLCITWILKKGKGSPYSIIERRVPELIPSRPAVTPATLKRAATNFAAW